MRHKRHSFLTLHISSALALLTVSALPSQAQAFPEFESDDSALSSQACGGDGCWTNYLRIDDLDGDGDLDIAFANYSGFFGTGTAQELAIYFNDGTGGFDDVSAAAVGGFVGRVRQVAAADIDGDRDLDLFAPDGQGSALDVLFINDGDGNFANEAAARLPDGLSSSAGAARFADVDSDGDMDLFVSDGYTGGASQVVHLYLNDGEGNFTDASDQMPSDFDGSNADDIDVFDIDGDFDLDIMINMHAGDNNLFVNDGDGNFSDGSDQLPGQPNQFHYNPGVCDVDNDGDLDIWVDNMGPGYSEQLLINDGDGNFADETAARVSGNNNADDNGVACVDFDHDGDFDAVVWSLSNVERLLENDGSGNFTAVDDVFESIGDPTLWGDFGDLDGDGILDAVTGQGEGNPERNLVYFGTAEASADDRAPEIRAQEDVSAVDADSEVVLRFAVRDAVVADSGPRLNRAWAAVTVDGDVEEFGARFMGGDLFRVVIPGQADGVEVEVALCAEDRAGNSGCGELIMYQVGQGGTGETGTTDATDSATETGSETDTDMTDSMGESGTETATDTSDTTDTSSSTSTDSEGDEGGDGGCDCRADAGAGGSVWMLGVMGLVGLRRRRR